MDHMEAEDTAGSFFLPSLQLYRVTNVARIVVCYYIGSSVECHIYILLLFDTDIFVAFVTE